MTNFFDLKQNGATGQLSTRNKAQSIYSNEPMFNIENVKKAKNFSQVDKSSLKGEGPLFKFRSGRRKDKIHIPSAQENSSSHSRGAADTVP